MDIDSARTFIYRNARPLDVARWKYLFEDGSQADVVTALLTYQNEDGGFAHALEPDCWNPHSSPIQTWVATEIISEIGLNDRHHPMIQGILRYLGSGADFDGHRWSNTVAANNDYPHAPWWNHQEEQALSYNPTAALLGFVMKFSNKNDQLYLMASRLVQEAYHYFKQVCPTDSMHTASCFIRLYEYLKEAGIEDVIDMHEFNQLLHHQIKASIEGDTTTWKTEYVCRPSLFITTKTSDFYLENQSMCRYECQWLEEMQNKDGTWHINWAWDEYPEAWFISKNWWKSDVIIKNIKFYQAMNKE